MYRIILPKSAELQGYLLRLHKDVPWIPSYAALQAFHSSHIQPLFPIDALVTQKLIPVPPGLIAGLNNDLHLAEAGSNGGGRQSTAPPSDGAEPTLAFQHVPFVRPPKRHGLYLAEAEVHAMLIADMTADACSDRPQPYPLNVAWELKPKWLAQSPNASLRSRRCRTCALREYRNSVGLSKGDQGGFCPLDLVSEDREAVCRGLRLPLSGVVKSTELPADDAYMVGDQLTDSLVFQRLLRSLRDAQVRLDPRGILCLPEGDVPSMEFLTATTLRDCTLFIRVRKERWSDEAFSVETRLGDLDLKEPEIGKIRHWRETERSLVEGGWYAGRSEETVCLLARTGVDVPPTNAGRPA